MAYAISSRAKQILDQVNIEPNIILSIDGYPTRFAVTVSKVYVTIGMPGLTIGDSWRIGGVITDETIVDYISLDGTTTNVTQQLDLDKGGASSVQTIKVRLVDFNGEITSLISPGFDLNDLLYKNAQIYLGFKEGAFPDDYTDLFIGKIQTIDSGSGYVELTIANAEELKRTEIFIKSETTLVTQSDYYNAVVQDLTYYQHGTLDGVAQVRYINTPFLGDVANVSTSGNLITVVIETGVTKAKTIKAAIENHIAASKIATPLISGIPEATQVTQSIVTLTVASTIEVDNVVGFLPPLSPIFRTYIRINDEIIEYTGINTLTNTFTGCVRHSLNSLGATHEVDDSVISFYKLGDNTYSSNAIDLSLKVMLSDGIGSNYINNLAGLKFYNFGTPQNYINSFIVLGTDIIRFNNVQAGDTCTVSGSTIPGNNITDGLIKSVEAIDLGTIVTIDGYFPTVEASSPALVSFKSQYNILPDGCGFIPAQVDINRFIQLKKRFPSSIANYEIYLKDTIKPKDLINTDIFLPSALYSIPRQGKSSIGINAPPLYEGGTKTLNINTLKNPKALKISRSVQKYFYNSIIYKYNEDSVDDRTLNSDIIYSADSYNRIESPNKPYTINAKGIRPSPGNDQLITRNSKRFLQRYQYAAETIPVEPDYKTGYSIEVGDSVVFGDEELQLSDTINGTRNYQPRVFEVVNKSFDWRKGKITLNIVDTNYSASVRYGVWGPSSQVVSGSSTSILVLNSFGSTSEKDKWTPYIGKTIRIRSSDYTQSVNIKFLGIDTANDNLILTSTIPFTPSSGMVVDVPNYDDLNLNADAFYKALHPFWTPTLTVVSGSSSISFDVSLLDAAKLFAGCVIRIHSADYSIDSYDKIIKVSSIVGTTVTCDDIGFTPAPLQLINLVGFVSDNGNPYVWT